MYSFLLCGPIRCFFMTRFRICILKISKVMEEYLFLGCAFIFTVQEVWRTKDQGADLYGVWQGASSWFADNHLLSMSINDKENKLLFHVSSYKALIPFMRGSILTTLITSQRSHLKYHHIGDVRLQQGNFGRLKRSVCNRRGSRRKWGSSSRTVSGRSEAFTSHS